MKNNKKEEFPKGYEKENLLDIISKTKKAIKEKDSTSLKELSNRTIHSASIYQDEISITLAVLIYALSKVFEREQYRQLKGWFPFVKKCSILFNDAEENLRKDGMNILRNDLVRIRLEINKFAGPLKRKVGDVFRKASINKASRLYEHGVSLEKTAKLLGISMFELVEYAGKTGISDVNLNITKDIKVRMKRASEIFK